MSWLEDIQNNLTITCGDGEEFTPQWLNATKEKEYNVSRFKFIDVPGELVDRKQPTARQYGLELYFTGDENISISKAFEQSADDSRAWTLSHPYYGDIIVQPVSIKFDNSQHNVTQISCSVVETITEDFPKSEPAPVDVIEQDVADANEQLAESFDDADSQSQSTLSEQTDAIYNDAKDSVPSDQQNEYFNSFREASSAITEATQKPLEAMRATQKVLNAPAEFGENVKTRIDLLRNQFDKTIGSIQGVLTLAQKLAIQGTAGSTLTAMAQATNGDYTSRDEALSVIEEIQRTTGDYLDAIGEMTGNGYLPNSDVINSVIYVATYAASNVLTILNDTRQERKVKLEADSNMIVVAHRFGMINDLDEFIKLNNIGLNEHLQIRKDREITYYV